MNRKPIPDEKIVREYEEQFDPSVPCDELDRRTAEALGVTQDHVRAVMDQWLFGSGAG